jgi:hypothetical protein
MPSLPEWIVGPQGWFLGALVLALLVLHATRRMFWVFSLLVLPGTLAHECCHLALGLLLGGRPSSFNLLPRRKEQGWEMGSVGFQRLTWLNAFFIGMAPLLLLPVAYGLVRWRLAGRPGLGWPEALAVYLIANLIYAALPSWQDLKIAARSPIGWILLAGGLFWGWHTLQRRLAQPPPPAPAAGQRVAIPLLAVPARSGWDS